MVENGYKRKFVNKVINRQISQSERSRRTTDENKGTTSIKLPFTDGLSQEVRRIVRCTFTAPNTLQKLHNVKDSLSVCSATHAINSIKCTTCDEEYIGEFMRYLDTRCKEHRYAIRLAQCTKSAVADHVPREEHSQPHKVDWQSVRILGRAQGTTERWMNEAMLIYQRYSNMNRDIGMERSSVEILFCEPAGFFLSSVVRSSCLDFSLIITDKNVFFHFLLIVNFDFRLKSSCFCSFRFQITCRFCLLVSNVLAVSVSSFSMSDTGIFLG